MRKYIRAVTVAIGLMLFAAGVFAAGVGDDAGSTVAPRYEVWAMDQSTNMIHIIEPVYGGGSVSFEVTDRIEFDERVVRPHMIDFTSDHRYAFVANTVSGNVAVIRTADRRVIDVIRTGPGTHMAAVAPGDQVVHVDVIADGTVVEINLDLTSERFTVGRTLEINRASSNAIVVDPATDAVIDYVPFVGESPDILAISPEGRFAFITLRGPEPLSGPHAIRGASPGVAVVDVDVAGRSLTSILLPESNLAVSDFHGIGTRPLD